MTAARSMADMELLSGERSWTVDDIDGLPHDGLRYELVDGTLLVSPSPSRLHQRVVGNLHLLLRAACPPHLELFLAPLDYRPSATRSLQPDLLVASRADPGDGPLTLPLVLAVEVVSPSSRSVDRLLKRGLYEESGVQQYWLVEPDAPSVTVLTRAGSGFGEPVVARDDERLELAAPLAVDVVPRQLLL